MVGEGLVRSLASPPSTSTGQSRHSGSSAGARLWVGVRLDQDWQREMGRQEDRKAERGRTEGQDRGLERWRQEEGVEGMERETHTHRVKERLRQRQGDPDPQRWRQPERHTREAERIRGPVLETEERFWESEIRQREEDSRRHLGRPGKPQGKRNRDTKTLRERTQQLKAPGKETRGR